MNLASLIRQGLARVDALSLRERAILVVGALAIIYFAWDLLLMQPLATQRQRAVNQINQTNGELVALNAQLEALDPARAAELTRQKRAALQQLRDEIAALDRDVADTMRHLVPPGEMTGLLQTVLRRSEGLELRQVNSLGMRQVDLAESGAADGAANRLFQHGLSVEFSGDFYGTLGYLQQLEALQWKFFWDSIDYQVVEYPRAVATVRIFTLSLNESWIGG